MSEPIFAIVRWQDAWADGVDDANNENVRDKHRPLEMETRGWVLLDDEVGVSLFYERCLEPLSYRGRTFIPRAMIISVEQFPPRRKPSKKNTNVKNVEKTSGSAVSTASIVGGENSPNSV